MGCKGALALADRIQKGQDVGYDPLSSKAAVLSCPLHCKEFVYCVVASADSLQEAILLLPAFCFWTCVSCSLPLTQQLTV